MMQRRDVLRTLAAGGLASTAGLAGCTTLAPGGGRNELPAYHRYVPAEGADGEGAFFATLDVARLRELEEADLEDRLPVGGGMDGDGGADDPDPLLAYPAAGILVVALGVSFGLFPYGFGEEIASGLSDAPVGGGTETAAGGEAGTETATDASRVDSMALVPGAVVVDGSFEEDRLAAATRGFSRDGEYGGYSVYIGGGDESMLDTSDLAFAVESGSLIALLGDDHGDPRAAIDATIDVASGDADRLSDDADADWALRTAGHGFTAFGGWGIDPDEVEPTGEDSGSGDGLDVESVLDRAHGLVSSLAIDGAAEATTVTVAAVYPEGETPTRERLESELGASASEREVEVDGTRVRITATWTAGTETG